MSATPRSSSLAEEDVEDGESVALLSSERHRKSPWRGPSKPGASSALPPLAVAASSPLSSPSSLALLLCLCLVLTCFAVSSLMHLHFTDSFAGVGWLRASSSSFSSLPLLSSPPGRTLIIFTHYEAEAAYALNFEFFINKAVRCWQEADYRFIIQNDRAHEWSHQPNNRSWTARLPALPSNAKYVLHKNECWDWGTVGWFLTLPPDHPDYVDTSRYRYFILMNSSVRGPFFPRFVEEQTDPDNTVQCPGDDRAVSAASLWPSSSSSQRSSRPPLFSWFAVFLRQLSEEVKYVGCTVNCLYWPHVQSYVVAMDYVALQVLWQADGLQNKTRPIALVRDWEEWRGLSGGVQALPLTGPVFTCPTSYWNAIEHELGASQAILKAGFNFGALMRYWQGVDFRSVPDPCSQLRLKHAEMDPTSQGVPRFRFKEVGPDNPLTPLEPLEVVFVKHKRREPHPSDLRTDSLIEWEAAEVSSQRWLKEHTAKRSIVYPGNLSLS